MNENQKWKFKIGAMLIISSVLIYALHLLVFNDLHHILVFGLEDLAFIPIEVFIVTLVIEGVLKRREKTKLLEKLNMLIGLFYTRMGLKLLTCFVDNDPNKGKVNKQMLFSPSWTDQDFYQLMKRINGYSCGVEFDAKSLGRLKDYLHEHREFLTGMLQNPNLMEHETFTELLSAIFHLQEELDFREDISHLKDYEIKHLNIDLVRVYKLLTFEYIAYMKYVKNEYPYMFVTAMIHNPYDPRTSEEIEEEIMKNYS